MSHIVHLTSVHSPFDTRIFHKECRSLVKAGHTVTLIAPHHCNETVQGVHIVAFPKVKGRLQRILSACRVYRKALQENAELYHFHDPELIPIGLLLRLSGKKVVYDIHEDLPRSLHAISRNYIPKFLKYPLSWLTERIENLTSAQFSGLITATSTIHDRFKDINKYTIVVNNYPLQEEFELLSNTEWTDRTEAIAYIGVIAKERGIVEIIKAIGLVNCHRQVGLDLAGVISPSTLAEELKEMEEWHCVNYRGMLDRSQVVQLLDKVRIGLVVLHSAPSFVVSLPVKMFEYMAAGIPIIASDFPLWREIVESANCGLLVDPLNPQVIAEAIQYLLTHPQEAEQMGKNGRIAIERQYCWETEANKLIRLYADLKISIWPVSDTLVDSEISAEMMK